MILHEQWSELETSATHPAQIKVLLCGVQRLGEHGEPLEGPGPPQDQERNQIQSFLHPTSLSVHPSLRGLMFWGSESLQPPAHVTQPVLHPHLSPSKRGQGH